PEVLLPGEGRNPLPGPEEQGGPAVRPRPAGDHAGGPHRRPPGPHVADGRHALRDRERTRGPGPDLDGQGSVHGGPRIGAGPRDVAPRAEASDRATRPPAVPQGDEGRQGRVPPHPRGDPRGQERRPRLRRLRYRPDGVPVRREPPLPAALRPIYGEKRGLPATRPVPRGGPQVPQPGDRAVRAHVQPPRPRAADVQPDPRPRRPPP